MIWNYAHGCVKIQVDGLSLDKFLNVAAQRGLRFRDAERLSYTSISVWMDAAGYKELLPVLRELHCRSHILEKHGLPFTMRRWRDRWMLPVGGLVCILALYIASGTVWDIRVQGNQTIASETIIEYVSDQAKIGTRIAKLDLPAIKKTIESADANIAWAGAQINGTRLTLHVVESDRLEWGDQEDSYADILATKDAMIAQITVLRGYAPVVEGDEIKAGDVLISGTMPATADSGERYVYARGKVLGRIWYSGDAEVARESVTMERNGNTEQVRALSLGGSWFDIGGNFSSYEAQEDGRIGIYNLFIPLELVTQTRYETTPIKKRLNDQEMKEQTEEVSWRRAVADIPDDARIVDQTVNFSLTSDGIRAVTVIETLEDIGTVVNFTPPQQPAVDPQSEGTPEEAANDQ